MLVPRLGLKIAIADVAEDKLKQVGQDVARIVGDANVLVVPTDVSRLEEVVRLRDKVYEQWGEVSMPVPLPATRIRADLCSTWRCLSMPLHYHSHYPTT